MTRLRCSIADTHPHPQQLPGNAFTLTSHHRHHRHKITVINYNAQHICAGVLMQQHASSATAAGRHFRRIAVTSRSLSPPQPSRVHAHCVNLFWEDDVLANACRYNDNDDDKKKSTFIYTSRMIKCLKTKFLSVATVLRITTRMRSQLAARDKATYSCPCAKGSVSKIKPTKAKLWP
jgi:hypothetical protein